MSVENALILSAGFGTRMGEFGVSLPKPLWPVFDLPMVMLHIKKLQKLGVKKIYINTHHQHEVIEKYITEQKIGNVEVIHEESILGSGGAIHNLKNEKKVSGSLIVVNADVFLELSRENVSEVSHILSERELSSVLISVKVPSESLYNRLLVENELLKQILPPKENGPSFTYSGVSIIDLDKMGRADGYSGFFHSVAKYREEAVGVKFFENAEYLDFGTIQNYFNSHFEVLNSNSQFRQSLVDLGGLNEKMIKDNSYRSPRSNTLSLKSPTSEKKIIELGNQKIELN